jgi:hypothetical protein
MPAISQLLNPLTEAGRAALDAVITRQAQIILHRRLQALDDCDARHVPAARGSRRWLVAAGAHDMEP